MLSLGENASARGTAPGENGTSSTRHSPVTVNGREGSIVTRCRSCTTSTGGPDDRDINYTSSSASKKRTLRYVIVFVYMGTFFFGVVGNSLTIYVLLRGRRIKNMATLFILNLAIADDLFVICLPLMAHTSFVNKWIFGIALCKVTYCVMI